MTQSFTMCHITLQASLDIFSWQRKGTSKDQKSKVLIQASDYILFVTDLSEAPTEEDDEIYNLVKNKKHLVVGTKSDLETKNNKYKVSVYISNLTKCGVNDLINKFIRVIFI